MPRYRQHMWEGIKRRTPDAMPDVLSTAATHAPARVPAALLSFACMRLGVALCAGVILVVGLGNISYTRSYFSDLESSVENLFAAGSIGVEVESAASAPSSFFRINCVPHATSTHTVVVNPSPGSNPLQYYTSAEITGGDEALCRGVHLVASLNGTVVYEGGLAAFAATTTEMGRWEFQTTAPAASAAHACTFAIRFQAWQQRHDLPRGTGFTDLEVANVSLAMWGVRINKVYPSPEESRGTGTSGQWLELYNQAPERLDLSGWEVCNRDVCDALPSGTFIPPRGFLMVAASEEVFEAWPAPRRVKRIALPDGAIGSGLAEEADMLLLRRSDGMVMDSMNWGEAEGAWPQFQKEHLWSPSGVSPVPEGEVLARVPTGYDTNTPRDWRALLVPELSLASPRTGMSWRWFEKGVISWEARNRNASDEALHIGLYLIADLDENGEPSAEDRVFTIEKRTKNDGTHKWQPPFGLVSRAWVLAVATGPENPLLVTHVLSEPFDIRPPSDTALGAFELASGLLYGIPDGMPYAHFMTEADIAEFIPRLFGEYDDIPVPENADMPEERTASAPVPLPVLSPAPIIAPVQTSQQPASAALSVVATTTPAVASEPGGTPHTPDAKMLFEDIFTRTRDAIEQTGKKAKLPQTGTTEQTETQKPEAQAPEYENIVQEHSSDTSKGGVPEVQR